VSFNSAAFGGRGVQCLKALSQEMKKYFLIHKSIQLLSVIGKTKINPHFGFAVMALRGLAVPRVSRDYAARPGTFTKFDGAPPTRGQQAVVVSGKLSS
jgi:hypothetical protein